MSNKAKLLALTILWGGIGLALLAFLMPVPSTWSLGPLALHSTVATSILYTVFHAGAAILLVLGLKGFKTKLKIAYTSIAIGTVLAAICMAQLPVVSIFNLWESVWVKGGLAAIPFLFGAFSQYVGIRIWARQLQIKSLAIKWWFVLLVVAGGIISFVLLPHLPNPLTEFELDSKLGIYAWIIFLSALCIWLLWRMKQTAGKIYARPQTWLMLGLLFNAIAIIYGAVLELVGVPSYMFWKPFNICDEFFVLGGLAYLRAGYLFNRIGSYDDDAVSAIGLFSSRLQPVERNVTPFEVITHLASLASNLQEIDPILDKMRGITAGYVPGKPLSIKDQDTLIETYKELEKYLVAQEPVRKFTQPGLRDNLKKKFPQEVTVIFFTASPHSKSNE